MLGLLAAALLAQAELPTPTPPPLLDADPLPEPLAIPPEPEAVPPPEAATRREEVVSDREDVMTKSAWRLHFALGAGAIDYTASGLGGFWLEVGKPLYVGDRHAHHQWLLDSTVFVGVGPKAPLVVLAITPTVGTNWYFGDTFGLEWRGGMGFGATPAPRRTLIGVCVSLEGSLVFRVFGDDRRRLKATLRQVTVGDFVSGLGSAATAGLSVGYEMPLP